MVLEIVLFPHKLYFCWSFHILQNNTQTIAGEAREKTEHNRTLALPCFVFFFPKWFLLQEIKGYARIRVLFLFLYVCVSYIVCLYIVSLLRPAE